MGAPLGPGVGPEAAAAAADVEGVGVVDIVGVLDEAVVDGVLFLGVRERDRALARLGSLGKK